MAKVRKAVITAAGRGTRMYPASMTVQKELFPLVDTDGCAKPTLQIIAEEALASGVEEICIVANPSNSGAIKQHFRGLTEAEKQGTFAGKEWALAQADTLANLAERLSFVVQETQEGFGHAVYQAKDWAGGEPFALLLGDHVYLSDRPKRCTRQVMDAYEAHGCAVSSVARLPENVLFRYGTISGARLPGSNPPVYQINAMTEKPTVEYAREHLRTLGLAEGEYLCFFGIHVFPPSIFGYLEHLISHNLRHKGEIQMTSAQELLLAQERYLVAEVAGTRYDMGVPEGLVETQIALALHSPFREAATHLFHALGNKPHA